MIIVCQSVINGSPQNLKSLCRVLKSQPHSSEMGIFLATWCLLSEQVDEIMMTLKQAFTVAAVQHTAKAPAQLCEGCPLQGLHKLCERIEGE